MEKFLQSKEQISSPPCDHHTPKSDLIEYGLHHPKQLIQVVPFSYLQTIPKGLNLSKEHPRVIEDHSKEVALEHCVSENESL
jgi:hypothetical protein